MLEVAVDQIEQSPLLALQGRFDGMGSGIFDAAVAQLAALPDGPILLDMKDVDYLSSAGIRSLSDWGRTNRSYCL